MKYLPRPHKKAAPRLREFRACMSSLEESLTVPIFELLNLRAQRRLRNVKLISSSSKTQLLGNGNECDEVTEIWALVHNALPGCSTWRVVPCVLMFKNKLLINDESCLSSIGMRLDQQQTDLWPNLMP